MAGYFSYLPNIYVGKGVTDTEIFNYQLVKNIFRKVRSRPDLDQYVSFFELFEIGPGETPASIAYDYFQDSKMDWMILLINNITDVYEQWPKEQEQLISFVNEKYPNAADLVNHYETNEITLDDGTVYIKEGIEVTEDFIVTMPDGTTKSAEESRYPVTNYEHEYALNELKRIFKSLRVDWLISSLKNLKIWWVMNQMLRLMTKVIKRLN